MKLKTCLLFVLSVVFVFSLSADGFAQGKGNSGRSHGKSKNDTSRGGNDDKGKGKPKKEDGLRGSDNRFKGLSKKLGRSPESLRDWYNAERAVNPNLNYGQFVAANMVARNHDMSPETFLRGLRRGRSIGQVLKDNGWNDDRIYEERKRLKKMRGDGWEDYVDRAIDWRF